MNKVFDTGDIIVIDFDPALGHEQKGRRPAFVLSPKEVNCLSSIVIVAAITNKGDFARDRGFTVSLADHGLQTSGVVRCDQVRSIDIEQRHASYKEHAPDELSDKVLGKVATILGI